MALLCWFWVETGLTRPRIELVTGMGEKENEKEKETQITVEKTIPMRLMRWNQLNVDDLEVLVEDSVRGHHQIDMHGDVG